MRKSVLIILVLFSIENIYGHVEAVHQYVVRQAYQLITAQLGHDIPKLSEHVGEYQIGDGQFVPGNLLVTGAYREDQEDIVFGYYGVFGILSTVSHFWEPDDGDNSKFSAGGSVYENAYYKATKMIYGGYEIQVPYSGSSIIEAYEAPSNLAQFYKDGIIFYKGYYNILGQFVPRNYWHTASQEFRDKIVWEILGRVCHLLADMSVPAHVHNDSHTPIPPDEDDYESMMYNFENFTLWDYQDALNAGGFWDVGSYTNPLKQLFYTTAQVADFFPSDDEGGDSGWGLNESFSNYPYLQTIMNNMQSSIGSPPTSVNLTQISDWAFVTAIRATAGLLYWFANEAEILPEFSLSPSSKNVGTITGLFNFTGSFTITNTGAGSLSGQVTTTNPYYDLDYISTPSTNESSISFYLSEGQSKTINYKGRAPLYAGPFVEVLTISTNSAGNKSYNIFGSVAVPDFCYPDESNLAITSLEQSKFDSDFKDYYSSQNKVENKKQTLNKLTSSTVSDTLSLREKLDFAYRLLKLDSSVPYETVCKMLIDKYPSTGTRIEFYALNLLWEVSLSDEAPNFLFEDFVNYLKELTEKKDKYYIYGYAELILGILQIEEKDLHFDNIEKQFANDDLKKMSLYLKFIHSYIYKAEKDKSRKISDKLDKKYPDSKYGYQAHLLMDDPGYTFEGLKELIKYNNTKLPKKYIPENINSTEIPSDYVLYKNYPNPFNPSTTIKYAIPENTMVKLDIYNSMGQLIKTLVSNYQSPGVYNIEWHGTNNYGTQVSSGIYFYKLQTASRTFSDKMVLMK